MPSDSVASQLDANKVADALEKLADDQRKELAQLTERLYGAKLELIQARRAEDVAAAKEAYAEARARVLEKVREAFHDQAPVVGGDRTKLAGIVGLPDPDPASKRKAKKGDPQAEADLERATRLRGKIKSQEEAFWAEVERLVSPVRGAFVDNLRQMAAKYDIAAEQARKDARVEAQDVLSGASSEIETPTVDLGVFMPAVPAQSTTVPALSVSGSAAMTRKSPAVQDSPAVAVFLRLRNYRLAKPGETAKDVTAEFEKWKERYSAR